MCSACSAVSGWIPDRAQRSFIQGQQVDRDNRISEGNIEYRWAFYPIDEAFTDSLKLLLQVNKWDQKVTGFFKDFFTPACDLYRRIFCPCEVGNLQQCGVLRWAFMFSFEIKVEGHKVTLPMCYTDKRQPYKCSVSFLFLNVNPQQVFMSRASKRDLCHLLDSYEGEIKNEQNLVKEVF